ncbi:MAG: hypothetical protein IJ371_05245 [Clostridia bacterium]|nr:hypothetical protein [Clostridia bacterium]
MAKLVRVDDAIHNYLVEMQKQTKCTLSQLVNYSVVAFRGTKDYAKLVLYREEPRKIKE